MKGRFTPLAVSLGFVGLQLARLAISFERLPQRMATHFDVSGKADGYQTRDGFAWTSVLISLALLALFAVLPAILARLPERMINLPNKDYWLVPERRAQILERLTKMGDWLGCATIGLLTGVFELVIRANLAGAPLARKSGSCWSRTICSRCSGWWCGCVDCAGPTARSERRARRTTLRA